MPYERIRVPNHVLEATGFQPISRPNVNFARTAHPLHHTHAVRDYIEANHPRDLRQSAHILDSENQAGINAPLPVSTSSINWWPYPPWGQSTTSFTPSETAPSSLSSLSPSPVAAVSAGSLTSTTSSLAMTPSLDPSTALGVTVISITAFPPKTSLPSHPNVHVTAQSSFNSFYLIPVFVIVGLLLGALSGLLGYRWYLRRRARNGSNSSRSWKATLIPGPPYVPMTDASRNAERIQEASQTTVGSPSKYTRHGAPRATKPWLRGVTGTSSRCSSTRSTVPLSREINTGAASSHPLSLSTSPTRARSQGSTISPVSLTDEESSRHDTTRNNASIRRIILDRLQRGPDRDSRGVSRDLSRRTAQTYLSTASAYSGTHSSDSRAPSAVPSSTPPSRDTNTEWEPGSGFRIVEEAISSPSTADQSPLSGIPGRTSAWDNGEAIRQAVGTHPDERWLAWTRSWASSPPHPSGDRFTAAPSRRTTQEKKDVEILLRSPPQLTSSPLQSTLTFSPRPGCSPQLATNGSKRHLQGTARTRPAPQAARGISSASSIGQGDGHGTPAMRYAARQTALSRVGEILASGYSSRDLAYESPNGFGAAPASLEDIAWAAGIEQRLAVAGCSDKDKV